MLRIVSVIGLKKTGKTTVVEGLVRTLTGQGHRVGTLKSMQKVHTTFTIDVEGKDTYRHRVAGAGFVIARSAVETSFIQRHEETGKKAFHELLRFVPANTDYLICEGLEERSEHIVEVLCLKAPEFWEETLAVRKPQNIIALSGILANHCSRLHDHQVFNVLEQDVLDKLSALVEQRSRVFPGS